MSKPRTFCILAVAAFAILVGAKYSRRTGLSELAGFGANWPEKPIAAFDSLDYYAKPNSTGYDGQFYVQIAMDPALREPELARSIDSPSYRSRRILLPAVAHVFGFGSPAAILQVYCTLNIVSWLACGMLLLHWIPLNSLQNFARWFFCMFSMGALESVRYSLTDLPSFTLFLGSLVLVDRGRGNSAIVAFIGSVFTKETSIINGVAFLPIEQGSQLFRRANLRTFAWAVGLSLVVFGLWMAYVNTIFPFKPHAAENMGIPFFGLAHAGWEAVTAISNGRVSERFVFRILAILGLSFQFGYLLINRELSHPLWRMGTVAGLLFITLGSAVWWGYWAACRVALPMTFAFNILLDTTRPRFFWSSIILSNLVFVHAIVRWL